MIFKHNADKSCHLDEINERKKIKLFCSTKEEKAIVLLMNFSFTQNTTELWPYFMSMI